MYFSSVLFEVASLSLNSNLEVLAMWFESEFPVPTGALINFADLLFTA